MLTACSRHWIHVVYMCSGHGWTIQCHVQSAHCMRCLCWTSAYSGAHVNIECTQRATSMHVHMQHRCLHRCKSQRLEWYTMLWNIHACTLMWAHTHIYMRAYTHTHHI